MVQLLEALVRGIEQIDPRMLCSILLLSSDGQRLGRGIAPSLPDFYNAATDGVPIGIGAGSCGTAAFTGQPVIVADIANHPYWVALTPLAAQAGLAACWSQPILSSSGQVLGTLGIYHRTLHTQSAADTVLIEQAARLASIAIEKCRSADQLIASEQRFRRLTNMSSDFYWESDSAHRLTQRTQSQREMAEAVFQQSEFVGQLRWEVPHRTPDAAGWLAHRALLQAHLPFRHFEISRNGLHGVIHHVSVCGDPIFNASGEFTGYQGVGRDTTEQSLALEAIQASNAFSVSILDSVAASVAVIDRAGMILRVNQSWLNFARDNSLEPGQLPAGTSVGSNYFSVCGDCQQTTCKSDRAIRCGLQQVLDGSLPVFSVEYPCHSPTRQHWFMMNVAPLGPQAQYGLVISHTDISHIKVTQEQLRIAAVAFESEEPTLIANKKGVVLQVNRAFVVSTGYAAEDIVGQTPHMLQSGRHGKAFYRSMWRTIKRSGGWQGEIWDKRKNGEIYPKWLTISAVKTEDGVVTHYVGTHQDSTERKRATERIHELAFFDQLTGLPNRTLLLDRLRQAMTASARSASFGSLLFIDLDHFKTLNDTLGHDIGDRLLKQVAQRLQSCMREVDTVARLGGDEFVVILADLSVNAVEAATDTEAVAAKILATLSLPYPLGEGQHNSSASIGITLFQSPRASIDDLMKQADLAMYRAKDAGRNAMRFFDPSMETEVVKRVAMEKDLRHAVAARQFVLHYQAQVEGAGQVTGAEVLVRWLHPERGLVPPTDFIPMAEETGLILPLGNWILETACRQLENWGHVPGMAHLTLAVNVSALQFAQTDFVEQVMAIVQRTGANPRCLKLELTESLLVGNVTDMIDKMVSLKGQGVGFSLDDFGTGYSSLAYLSRLPL
ncbi:MAG: bifunctional diguanylate cyclase/phosphodiesterase, partial [Rhodoferax sp.]